MIKLNISDSGKILHLVRTFDNHRAIVEAVVNGYEDGWIITDDNDKPTCFLIHENGGYFFLHGTPNLEFIDQISKHLYQDLKFECIEMVISDPALETVIPRVFGNRKYKIFQRIVFQLRKEKFHAVNGVNSMRLPDNWRVQKVNEDKSLSVTILAYDDVITHCKAIIGVNEFEIDIETTEKYRRKGYAMYSTHQLIIMAIKRGLIPVWSCWSFNDASIGLAEKLGFEKIRSIDVYLWDIY